MISKLFSFFRKREESFFPSYELVEATVDEMITLTGIRIKEGKYSNLVFSVPSAVSIHALEDGTPKLTYQHRVEYLPPGVVVEDDLVKIIGDIIVDTILKDQEI